MAAAGVVAGGLGTALSTIGQLRQGNAEAQAANYNADVNLQNADQSRAQAEEEARRLRISGQKTLGAIRANYGASGVGLEGSPLEVLRDNASNIAFDVLQSKYHGETKARAYENEATLDRARARNARSQSRLSAVATLLEGGSKTVARGYGYSGG